MIEAKQFGQYTLEHRIGAGAMGVVFKGHHAMLRRPTAIKMFDVNKVNENSLARFEREVQITCQLNHPNTIVIYDHGRTPEAIQTPLSVDARSDLYAVGAVGYFLLTGKPVFEATSFSELCRKHVDESPIPPSDCGGGKVLRELENALLASLDKSRAKRPQTARDLAGLLGKSPSAGTWTLTMVMPGGGDMSVVMEIRKPKSIPRKRRPARISRTRFWIKLPGRRTVTTDLLRLPRIGATVSIDTIAKHRVFWCSRWPTLIIPGSAQDFTSHQSIKPRSLESRFNMAKNKKAIRKGKTKSPSTKTKQRNSRNATSKRAAKQKTVANKKSASGGRSRGDSVDGVLNKFQKERQAQEIQLATIRTRIEDMEAKMRTFREQIGKLTEQEKDLKNSISQLDAQRDQEVSDLLAKLGVQLRTAGAGPKREESESKAPIANSVIEKRNHPD